MRGLAAGAPRARFLLSATTRTGRERLAGLGAPAVMAPLDAPQCVGRFFAGVAPRRLFVVETELWPHWLLRARERGVPVTVVSARLSERSVRGYLRLGAPLRELVGGLAGVLCQTEADLARWRRLGARRRDERRDGNLKDDGLRVGVRDRAAARAGRWGSSPTGRCSCSAACGRARCARWRAAWRRLPPGDARALAGGGAAAPSAGGRGAARRGGGRGAAAGPVRRRGTAGGVALGRTARRAERLLRGGGRGVRGRQPGRLRGAQPARARRVRRGAADGAAPRGAGRRGAGARAGRRAAHRGARETTWRGRWNRCWETGRARARAGRAALAVAGERQGAARRTVAWLVERGLWPVA